MREQACVTVYVAVAAGSGDVLDMCYEWVPLRERLWGADCLWDGIALTYFQDGYMVEEHLSRPGWLREERGHRVDFNEHWQDNVAGRRLATRRRTDAWSMMK